MTEVRPKQLPVDSEAQERYKKLFEKLDVNKDGKIEIGELSRALTDQKTLSAKDVNKQAQALMSKADSDKSAGLTFAEFLTYMQHHEQNLKLAFSDLDKNQDGIIEPNEVQAALSQLGIHVDKKEAMNLTKRLDKDGSLSVDFDEWREFFTLVPGGDLESMLKYWRQSLMIDIGDNLTCPPEFTKRERKTGMWWRHLVAGGLAGAVSRTCTAPLDRVKVMLQVQGAKANFGVIGGLKMMVKEGGVKSLWRGNGTNVLKIAPESAMKFAAYEKLKRVIVGDSDRPIGVVERFAAGSTAGAIAQTTIYPMEVIKTRLAVMQTGQYKGLVDCGLKIAQREGLLALYKGYIPNIMGIIPYAGIDLSIYETLKTFWLSKYPEQKDPGVMTLLACGTISSTCGQLCSYPLALIRTKLQASTESGGNFKTMFTHIIKTEGARGLYRGITPNFLKVLPAVSISYVIYERAKESLGVKR